MTVHSLLLAVKHLHYRQCLVAPTLSWPSSGTGLRLLHLLNTQVQSWKESTVFVLLICALGVPLTFFSKQGLLSPSLPLGHIPRESADEGQGCSQNMISPTPPLTLTPPPPNTHTCIFSFMRKYGKRADFIFRNYHFSKFFLLTKMSSGVE